MPELPKKLPDVMRDMLRTKHYSYLTEQAYTDWIVRYICFDNLRHPKDMGMPEINQVLTHLAVEKKVAASTQNQALSVVVFL